MRWVRFISKRLAIGVVQVFLIVLLTFVILRVLPANPAYRIAGFNTSPQHIHQIEVQLGLNKPITAQFWSYLKGIAHGNLGVSTATGDTVISDLKQRVPATLELILVGLTLAILIALPIGVWSARRRTGVAEKGFRAYSLLAGAQPEYWWALILIFIFFARFKFAPGPVGQIGIGIAPPQRITGIYLIDSLLTGNFTALRSTAEQLVLPVVTIVIVYMAPILKMTRSSYGVSSGSEAIRFMRASGLAERDVSRACLRLASPPIVTTIGITAAYLLGGAALIETVFGWNGAAQYAVQAAVNSDYAAMQGVVLAIAALAALIYLCADIVLAVLDPRVVSGA
jgi:peptide/nickel transport system permease protein